MNSTPQDSLQERSSDEECLVGLADSLVEVISVKRPQTIKAAARDELIDSEEGPPLKYVYIKYKAQPCNDLKFCDMDNGAANDNIDDSDDEDSEDELQEPHMLSWAEDDDVYEDYLDEEDDDTTICSIPNDPFLNNKLQRTKSWGSINKYKHDRKPPFVTQRAKTSSSKDNGLTWSGSRQSPSAHANAIFRPTATHDLTTRTSDASRMMRKPTQSASPRSVLDVFSLNASGELVEKRGSRFGLLRKCSSRSEDKYLPTMITCSYDIPDDDSFDWANLPSPEV